MRRSFGRFIARSTTQDSYRTFLANLSGGITTRTIILAGGPDAAIRSENFTTGGATGWAVLGDGSAWFNQISALGGTIGGWTIGATTLTGGAAVLDSAGVLTLGTGNDRAVLDAFHATHRLWVGDAAASLAPFSVTKAGELTALSGSIGNLSVTDWLTITGGGLRTATSGQRVEISQSAQDRIDMFSGHGTETAESYLASAVFTLLGFDYPALRLSGPKDSALGGGAVDNFLEILPGTWGVWARQKLTAKALYEGDDPVNAYRVHAANRVVSGPDGSAAAPAMSFVTDPDTGAFRPAANSYGVATGGVERLRVSNTDLKANDGTTGLVEVFPRGTLLGYGEVEATGIAYAVTDTFAIPAASEVEVDCEYNGQSVLVDVTALIRFTGLANADSVRARVAVNGGVGALNFASAEGPGIGASQAGHSHTTSDHAHARGSYKDGAGYLISGTSATNNPGTNIQTPAISTTSTYVVTIPACRPVVAGTGATAGKIKLGVSCRKNGTQATLTQVAYVYKIWRL